MVGSWNGEAGAAECTQCTADSSTAAEGATTITECLCNVGHSGDIVDAESVCTACGLATYKGEDGPGECTTCPGAGVTTAATGSTVVTQCLCVAGHSGDIVDTDSECTIRAEGTWNADVGPGACTECPEFASTAAEGATTITDCLCEPGYSGDIAIPTDLCTGCELGTFKPVAGPEACTDCTENADTAVTGAAEIGECRCLAGFGRDGPIVAEENTCDACAEDTFKAQLVRG